MRTKLKKEEKVHLTTRQHWFPCLFTPLFLVVLLLVMGIGMEKPNTFYYILSFIVICFLVYRIIQRQFNIWVVTNLRVIDENGILSHLSIESSLDKINNVSFRRGILGGLFGYGNVEIQTAAGHGATIYKNVENPELLKDTITTMQEDYKKSATREQTTVLASVLSNRQQNTGNNSISAELEKIFELKQKGVLSEEEYNKLKMKILNS